MASGFIREIEKLYYQGDIKNININTLSPGWFPRKGKKSRNDYMKMITKDIPQKRIGNLTDLVSVINFLISTGSKYFTGQTVKIDGGHSVW